MSSTSKAGLLSLTRGDIMPTADKDLCAVFQTSFHPTKGNVIDYSVTSSDDIKLDGVEFSTLPSGLHVVDEDVIYFTKGAREGVCIFRRRKTEEEGMRGYRLGALGVLLEESARPRPWLHVSSLRRLADNQDSRGDDYTDLKEYYESNRVGASGAVPDLETLSEELLNGGPAHPLLHLPHLLRLMGPNGLVPYKYALARKRVMIYTHPSVEPACMLAACIKAMADVRDGPGADEPAIPVLGLIGLMDIDRLKAETDKNKGWIACTTDAIFKERPQLYDLIIDLATASLPSRPQFYASHRVPHATKPSASYILRPARFTWSDLTLWSSIDRCLRCAEPSAVAQPVTASEKWSDPWKVYEDVCTMCAGMLAGGWSAGSGVGIGESGVRLEGEDEVLTKPVKPKVKKGSLGQSSARSTPSSRWTMDATSAKSVPLSTATGDSYAGKRVSPVDSPAIDSPADVDTDDLLPSPQHLTTLTLLGIFTSHSSSLLAALSLLLSAPSSLPASKTKTTVSRTLTPRDLITLRLGPLSAPDARFVEWLARDRLGRRVVVRRTWWDLSLGLLGW